MIKSASDFIAEAQQICNCIDVITAKELANLSDNVVILDVREPHEAAEEKLQHSINIPRGLLEMKVQNHCTEPDTLILIHCAAGGRASLAAARLHEMGYRNVHAVTAKFEEIKKILG